jgi:hypothetical protein
MHNKWNALLFSIILQEGCGLRRVIEYQDVLARAVSRFFVASLLNYCRWFDGHNILWNYFTIELPRYLGSHFRYPMSIKKFQSDIQMGMVCAESIYRHREIVRLFHSSGYVQSPVSSVQVAN